MNSAYLQNSCRRNKHAQAAGGEGYETERLIETVSLFHGFHISVIQHIKNDQSKADFLRQTRMRDDDPAEDKSGPNSHDHFTVSNLKRSQEGPGQNHDIEIDGKLIG